MYIIIINVLIIFIIFVTIVHVIKVWCAFCSCVIVCAVVLLGSVPLSLRSYVACARPSSGPATPEHGHSGELGSFVFDGMVVFGSIPVLPTTTLQYKFRFLSFSFRFRTRTGTYNIFQSHVAFLVGPWCVLGLPNGELDRDSNASQLSLRRLDTLKR